MKKNLLYAICTLLVGSVYSCDSALEVVPENSVTFENVIRDEKGIESMVNAVRGGFRDNISMLGGNPIFWKGLIYDEANNYDIDEARHMSTYAYAPFMADMSWNRHYITIAQANIVLDYIMYAGDIKQDRTNFYTGQAYFYRAYSYLEIAQTWGDAVIMTTGRDDREKPKSPWYEVVHQALADVNEAIRLLPGRDSLYSYAGDRLDRNDVPSREAAYALKAFICAWEASLFKEYFGKEKLELFQEAIDAASKVIDPQQPNPYYYELAPTIEDVCNGVLMGNSREGIFEIWNNWNESRMSFTPFTGSRHYVTWPVRRDMEPSSILTPNRVELGLKINYTTVSAMFEQGDERRQSYFYKLDSMGLQVSKSITGGFAYPYKFRKEVVYTDGYNKGQFMNYDQPRIIYRLADLILLRAECYARLGKDAPAIADLNRIRTRAKATLYPAPADTKDLRYAIFKEREKELLWEDTRYFDMVRNNYFRQESPFIEEQQITDEEIRKGALYLSVDQDEFYNNRYMVQNAYWQSRMN